jgi:hypothetical protein
LENRISHAQNLTQEKLSTKLQHTITSPRTCF